MLLEELWLVSDHVYIFVIDSPFIRSYSVVSIPDIPSATLYRKNVVDIALLLFILL